MARTTAERLSTIADLLTASADLLRIVADDLANPRSAASLVDCPLCDTGVFGGEFRAHVQQHANAMIPAAEPAGSTPAPKQRLLLDEACPECGKRYATKAGLGSHRRYVHGVAGASKGARSVARLHRQAAGQARVWYCCGVEFPTEQKYAAHLRLGHPRSAEAAVVVDEVLEDEVLHDVEAVAEVFVDELEPAPEAPILDAVGAEPPLEECARAEWEPVCVDCGREFGSRGAARAHRCEERPVRRPSNLTADGRWRCPQQCGRTFATEGAATNHGVNCAGGPPPKYVKQEDAVLVCTSCGWSVALTAKAATRQMERHTVAEHQRFALRAERVPQVVRQEVDA